MQRIILTGVTLLAFAAAQAQNTSVLNQNGNSQTATFYQQGALNEATIRQITGTAATPNMGNVASVTQTAVASPANRAFIDQINGADYNQAIIRQATGSDNRATIEQKGGNTFRSGGSVLHSGQSNAAPAANEGNYARIDQTGSGNNQTGVFQNAGTLGGSGANFADLKQVGTSNGPTVIEQNNDSYRNRATLSQGATNGGATGNTASIRQSDDSELNLGIVRQEGQTQTAEVQQVDQSIRNEATVEQNGAAGLATLIQSSVSEGNVGEITQESSLASPNLATISQTTSSYYNQATIAQAGQLNTASIFQQGEAANNTAGIEQGAGGQNNLADITQTYAYEGASAGAVATLGGGNSASIEQNVTTSSTTGNIAIVEQGFANGVSPLGGPALTTSGSDITISQENDVNVTRVQQGGQNNSFTGTQTGYSTIKGVDSGMTVQPFARQIGADNTLNVTQNGTLTISNVANVLQTGTANMSTIVQGAQVP